MPTNIQADPYKALRYREFQYYLVARFLITISLTMQAVTIGYEVYELSHSKLLLGLIGLTEAIPAISIAMYGGYIADKSEKRTLYALLIALFTLMCVGLLFVTFPNNIRDIGNNLALKMIFIIIFFTGIVRSFAGPASFGLYAQIVPKSVYQSAITWSSSAWQMGAVLGPAIGGLLLARYGISITFCCIVTLLIIAIILILSIEKKPILYIPQGESMLQSAVEGLRFVWRSKDILSCISLDLFAVLFGGAVALLPVYAKDILHIDAAGLGWLRAAPAMGAIVVLLLLAYFPIRRHAGIKLLGAVLGFGFFIILFGLSKNFYFSMFCLIMSGALDGISVAVRHTIIQLSTPDEMRGRVSAVNSMFIGSSNEIGEFESGITAHWMGTVPAVIFGGCMTCMIVVLTYCNFPQLRKLELK
jgi:MFS family permease